MQLYILAVRQTFRLVEVGTNDVTAGTMILGTFPTTPHAQVLLHLLLTPSPPIKDYRSGNSC